MIGTLISILIIFVYDLFVASTIYCTNHALESSYIFHLVDKTIFHTVREYEVEATIVSHRLSE